jgi:diguanylate cyclase
MRLVPPNSLAVKITSIVLFATGIAVGTLVVTLLISDRMNSIALLQNRLGTLAQMIGQNSAAALDFNDSDAGRQTLSALQTEPSIVSACLFDSSGNLFASYVKLESDLRCPTRSDRSQLSDGKRLSTIRPISRHNNSLGSISVISDLGDLEKRGNHLLLLASALALLSLFIGVLSGALLQRSVTKPIGELARVMEEVTTHQNFVTRAAVSGTTEIAQLGNGLNSMLSGLERRDVEKKDDAARLLLQTRTDALTGLPNRRMFSEQLSIAISNAQRDGARVGLLYIDLDGFKLVNDSLGHLIGDRLLCEVATRLQSRVRRTDTLSRLGGDEFAVILPQLETEDDATRLSKDLLDMLAVPFLIEDKEITIGASIGISMRAEDAQDGTDLLRQADSAMYAAKRKGKNQIMYFHPEIGLEVCERLNLENELRGALKRGEIVVHYQPEFDTTSGRLIRFEALARWFHPTLGRIRPDKFIPIAEESGLIHLLGAFIMEQACIEAVKWQSVSPYPVQIAVNVSSVQFDRESIVEEIAEILNRTGLNPGLLQVELTETVMVGSLAKTAGKMKRLHEIGVTFAIDDFGTGYSSLSYLPDLSFDAIKVDRSFVRNLSSRPETQGMVRSLIDLAHNLKLRVIVEGVETEEQLEVVRKLAGNEVQGFLLGRPMANPESLLSKGPGLESTSMLAPLLQALDLAKS